MGTLQDLFILIKLTKLYIGLFSDKIVYVSKIKEGTEISEPGIKVLGFGMHNYSEQ